jgi:hypothetical protein
MATYNHLPTDLTANIFTYLRRERRRPSHFTAINELIDYINADIIYEDDRIVCRRIYDNYAPMKDQGPVDPYEEPFEDEDDNVWATWYDFKTRWARHRLVRRLWVNMIEARTDQQSLAAMLEEYRRYIEDGDYELPETMVISEWVIK